MSNSSPCIVKTQTPEAEALPIIVVHPYCGVTRASVGYRMQLDRSKDARAHHAGGWSSTSMRHRARQIALQHRKFQESPNYSCIAENAVHTSSVESSRS